MRKPHRVIAESLLGRKTNVVYLSKKDAEAVARAIKRSSWFVEVRAVSTDEDIKYWQATKKHG